MLVVLSEKTRRRLPLDGDGCQGRGDNKTQKNQELERVGSYVVAWVMTRHVRGETSRRGDRSDGSRMKDTKKTTNERRPDTQSFHGNVEAFPGHVRNGVCVAMKVD